ncbi:MAG: hypothetical protein KGJ62_04230 [Armatimonadetes bacterium]|nr:hypothetical protein [Armatimonadota bacterium]MDE2205689.1 hypothetical protein [Armatimonadota bacterium]
MSAALYPLETAFRAALSICRRRPAPPTDLLLCTVDHFEPHMGGASDDIAYRRTADWLERFPRIRKAHRDSAGCMPAHTLFYPWDEFEPGAFEQICDFCRAGNAEVEIHLHHENDTEAGLRQKLQQAIGHYTAGGALARWPDGKPAFAFIHGNWALNNSRIEAGRNYCGVQNETDVLWEEGCYADFTFPAWKKTSQPRQVNSIFYAHAGARPGKPHDRGVRARRGHAPPPGLMIVSGPLTPYADANSGRLKLGMDDGDLAATFRFKRDRISRWLGAGIHVMGRPDRLFIKLHCHGAPDANREMLLGSDLDALYTAAGELTAPGSGYRIHYVTARQMFNVIRATELDLPGPVESLRDAVLQRPAFAG